MARHPRQARRGTARHGRSGAGSRRRFHAVRRIESILDASHGRGRGQGREDYDRRDRERGPRPRFLDLERNGPLFNRLAVLDFEYMLGLPFAADAATLRLLLPQSVHGRAQNGHGHWHDEEGTPLVFRDATFDRVLTAIEPLDPGLRADLVRKERGRRLERLGKFLLGNLHQDELVLEDRGEPLLGIELLRGARVETRGFLQGMLLAGWMDDFDQRQACMIHHKRTFGGDPLILGGGKTFVVRPDLLRAVGIVDPGQGEFAPDDIDSLIGHGIIQPEDREYGRPEFEQAYFRLGAGEGVCDDLALLYVGARYGWSAYLGAFLMDAVDTYDKFLWRFRPGGVDGRLASAIQAAWRERFDEELIDAVAILDVIRYAAKGNDPSCFLSSSHRRFIQTEVGSRVPTLLNHWSFLEGDPIYDIELGYSRFPSRSFYDIARKRFSILEIGIPEPSYTWHGRRR